MRPGERILIGTTTDAGRRGNKNLHPVGPPRSGLACTPGPVEDLCTGRAEHRGPQRRLPPRETPGGARPRRIPGRPGSRPHVTTMSRRRPRDVTTPGHNRCGTPVALAHPGGLRIDRDGSDGSAPGASEENKPRPARSANRSPFLHPRGGVVRHVVKSDQTPDLPSQEPLEARSSDESCRRSRSLTTQFGQGS